EILAPLIPEPGAWSPREPIPPWEIVNGISYLLRTGCSWRQMPHDLPNGKTVSIPSASGSSMGPGSAPWRPDASTCASRWSARKNPVRPLSRARRSKPVPSEAPGAVSTAEKKIDGRKRQVLVDTQSLILAVLVHAAIIGERDGARALLQQRVECFPRLRHRFADHGSTGPLIAWIKEHPGWNVISLATSPATRRSSSMASLSVSPGFQVQRQRWKVERTIGWLIRCRRLARDDEVCH